MNGTFLPAWLHAVTQLVISIYLFMLWRGLARGELSEGQKRFVDRIGFLRSKGVTLTVACLALTLAAGNTAWAIGYRW